MTEQEFISFLGQKLTEIASIMMNYYDCCHIQGSSCKAGDPNLCCIHTQFGRGLCPFWMHDRCQYDNCDCKLWVCKTAIDSTDPKCVEGLVLLEKFGKLYGLVREPIIGKPYVGGDRRPT